MSFGSVLAPCIAAISIGAGRFLGLMAISRSLRAGLRLARGAAAGLAMINSFGYHARFASPTSIGWISPNDASLDRGMVMTGGFF